MGHRARGPEDMGQTRGEGEEAMVGLLPWEPTRDGGRRG